MALKLTAVIVTSYILGSIPFGYLIVRVTAGADVRDTGSGGTGATNVTRRAGKMAGVLTLVLDAAKGAGAVALAGWLLPRGGRRHRPATSSAEEAGHRRLEFHGLLERNQVSALGNDLELHAVLLVVPSIGIVCER